MLTLPMRVSHLAVQDVCASWDADHDPFCIRSGETWVICVECFRVLKLDCNVAPRPAPRLTVVGLLVCPGHRRQQRISVAHARLLKLLVAGGDGRAGQRLVALLVPRKAIIGNAAGGVKPLASRAPELAVASRQRRHRRRRLHAAVGNGSGCFNAGCGICRDQPAPRGGLAVGRGLATCPVCETFLGDGASTSVCQRQHGGGGGDRQERPRQDAAALHLQVYRSQAWKLVKGVALAALPHGRCVSLSLTILPCNPVYDARCASECGRVRLTGLGRPHERVTGRLEAAVEVREAPPTGIRRFSVIGRVCAARCPVAGDAHPAVGMPSRLPLLWQAQAPTHLQRLPGQLSLCTPSI